MQCSNAFINVLFCFSFFFYEKLLLMQEDDEPAVNKFTNIVNYNQLFVILGIL